MNGKTTFETAYYLLSTTVTPERFAQIVRSNWAIENSLHWCLDVIMNEDQARARMDNAPHNLAVLRHLALNAVRKDPAKGSLRVKLKRASWRNKYLVKLLTLF
jgi:predicted transposase YbfD/YdcC